MGESVGSVQWRAEMWSDAKFARWVRKHRSGRRQCILSDALEEHRASLFWKGSWEVSLFKEQVKSGKSGEGDGESPSWDSNCSAVLVCKLQPPPHKGESRQNIPDAKTNPAVTNTCFTNSTQNTLRIHCHGSAYPWAWPDLLSGGHPPAGWQPQNLIFLSRLRADKRQLCRAHTQAVWCRKHGWSLGL